MLNLQNYRALWVLMLLIILVLSDDTTTHDPDHDHDHHDDDHHHHHDEEESWKTMKMGTLAIVGCSTLSVLTISVLPAILLLFIPVKNPNGQLLKFLLAFGAGGLLGDAILHIIPHAMIGHSHGAHEHEHGHEHEHEHGNITDDHHHHHHEEAHGHEHEAHDHSRELMVGLYVIAGILVFMIFEQVTRIFRNATNNNHSHHEPTEKLADATPISIDASLRDPSENEQKSGNEPLEDEEKGQFIRSSAYLNLVADFLHNITDGFAIGASFSINLYTGLMITGSVFIHEIPHEIGDFAILVRSGFTKFQAIGLQFVTALGALTGCYFAIWLADGPNDVKDRAAQSWIMPLTAGGFIYIATVSVLPEILEANPEYSLREQILHGVLITLFFLVGIALMYLVAYFE